MSILRILHLSDLHFSGEVSPLSPDEAIELACDALVRENDDLPNVMVISGDITTSGTVSGYHDALASLRRTLLETIHFSKIRVCPGNHDIVDGDKSFSDFNQFSLDLTVDSNQIWNQSSPVVVSKWEDYEFFLVNSSYHGDYSYGKTPLDALTRALERSTAPYKIAVIHHSPISSSYAGGGLSDAYDLLSLVSEHKVLALLHGHVHSDQSITVGRDHTYVTGAGSLGFSPDGNMNNQFSQLTFTDGALTSSKLFKYHANTRMFTPQETKLP